MSHRNQMIVLAVLAVGLGYRLYVTFWTPADPEMAASPIAGFTPVNVDNPALRMDILRRFLDIQYRGVHRNIFSATLPPPPEPPKRSATNVAAAPSGPPPLTVDAKYFGYVSDARGSQRRAFFADSNNEDVFIAGEGDTILGRFRVVKLTETTADLEELSSGRRATLTLEQPGPTG